VSIDRSSMAGAPAPLVITDDGSATSTSGAVFRFTDNGVGYVVKSVRTTTMPDSADANGTEVVSFSLEPTSLPLEFYVIGSSSAVVDAGLAEIADALFRLDYPLTRTVDGVAHTYRGGPCAPAPIRSSVDAGVVAAHFDTFAVTIPIPSGA
jgi:hypothetical protein